MKTPQKKENVDWIGCVLHFILTFACSSSTLALDVLNFFFELDIGKITVILALLYTDIYIYIYIYILFAYENHLVP